MSRANARTTSARESPQPVVEAKQLGVGGDGINFVPNSRTVEVQTPVFGANFGHEIDMAQDIAVLRRIHRQALRLAYGIGFRVIVRVQNVHDDAVAVLARDQEVREEPAPDAPVKPWHAERPTFAVAVS